MKRASMIVTAMAFVAGPAPSQWTGMPDWNSPRGGGGTGITIAADYGRPNEAGGKGNAFGGRASVGVGTLTLTAGVATWKPDSALSGGSDAIVTYGGTVGVRLIGGGLLPVAINLEGGASRTAQATAGLATVPAVTTLVGAVGIGVPVSASGVNIEPWVSPGIRYYKPAGGPGDTNFGFAVGTNVSFGTLGLHLAYDYEKQDDGSTQGLLGLGAQVRIKVPSLGR